MKKTFNSIISNFNYRYALILPVLYSLIVAILHSNAEYSIIKSGVLYLVYEENFFRILFGFLLILNFILFAFYKNKITRGNESFKIFNLTTNAIARKLTMDENIEFYASLSGQTKKEISESKNYVYKVFGLEQVKNKHAYKLSGGWQRKVSIAISLINDPKILFLDEPTLGLDVIARKELWNVIEKLKGKITIILTTHYMEEAADADYVVIIDSGKFDWEASGNYPAISSPNPSYHGVSFTKAVGPAAFVTYVRAILLRDTGATISPFAAFLLLQGVETLSLRLERHAENTKKVVEFLKNHPQVEKVNHPSLPEHPDNTLYQKYFPNGGGSIFTFEIKGGQEEAHKFIDNLKIFSLLANVADAKSLVIHPATTTHSQLTEEELADHGIKPNTIRLSIGTEHIDDIIADLQNGFKVIKEG